MEQLSAQRACPDRSTARVTAVTFKMRFHLLPTILLLYILPVLRVVPTLYYTENIIGLQQRIQYIAVVRQSEINVITRLSLAYHMLS